MSTRTRTRMLGAAVMVVCLTALAGPAGAGGRPFNLAMSGAAEFNAAGAPINPHGDADRGSINLTLNPGQSEVCWTIGALTLTTGESLPHVAHIHVAPAGVAGPVVIDLFGTAGTPAAPTSYPTETNCVSADRDTIIAILQDPSAYYVNLHNVQHPAGVMRAQLA
jgi:CHRD domain